MTRFTRRQFLQTSAAVAGSTFVISGTKSSGNVLGANDRIRVAVAGLHGRGKSHMDAFAKLPGVEVSYLVDPDSRQFDPSVKRIEEAGGNTPNTVQDIRKALEDPNVDAVTIATPNHWHALMTIWACEAGKDVYVEKPCSHNIHEGRIAVETARKHNCIVQHGTQSRSNNTWAQIMEVIKSGHYGQLRVARGLCHKRRTSIGFKSPEPPPSALDFDLWLGPAPEQSYHGNLVHYNWHWFWDTGNGDIGNQGVHEMDLARWGIPGATLPKSVVSLGGRFGYEDQGQTANTQVTIFDYGETQLIFQVRGLETQREVTAKFHFDDGTIKNDGKFYRTGESQGESIPDVEYSRGPGGGPFKNFIAAVRSRNVEDLNADILEGHYSSALCHLANISYRLGEQVPFDTKRKAFTDNPAASATFAKMEEHLVKENGIKLDETQYTLGRHLTVDLQNEAFVDDQEANALVTRNYRAPFVVPEKVS